MVTHNLINLSSDCQTIGEGLFCTCYLHPEDNSICIKLPTSHKKARKRQKADEAYYRKLYRNKADLTYISDYLGSCQTSLGPGHLYQYIKDENGKTSKTLNHYLANYPQKTEELCTHLAKLGCYLLENHILVSDLHGNNIVFQHLSENSKKLMIVDGIGDRVIFTAPNFFNSIKAGKIIRRWNKFIRRLQADHPSAPLPKEQLYLGNEALTNPKTVTRAH